MIDKINILFPVDSWLYKLILNSKYRFISAESKEFKVHILNIIFLVSSLYSSYLKAKIEGGFMFVFFCPSENKIHRQI